MPKSRSRSRNRNRGTSNVTEVESSSSSGTDAQVTTDGDENEDSQTAVNNEREVTRMAGIELTTDQIAELLAGARSKGAGDEVLKDFLESGSAGIEVDLNSGPFAGKTADQAAVSLNNAKQRVHKDGPNTGELVYPDAKQVVVRKIVQNKGKENEEGHVFLIDKAKVAA